ncbi:MAG: hypothetical protein EZS28_001062 [Streblomastix strix]|uniref:Uncharacterized protein n=1 Tax=Streblomastix strix TaxID=222440 RepID=A0A5J4XA49_9EUKA|nr:MAG: hypothetical protein EZS28_001062 [Streblomastix strix]
MQISLKIVSIKAICPIEWFETWNGREKSKQQIRTYFGKTLKKRSLTREKCSKEVHVVMSSVGIDEKQSVTIVRKVAIFAMQNKNKTKIEIDRWSRYSESADKVRYNYDVNNNDSIRKELSE